MQHLLSLPNASWKHRLFATCMLLLAAFVAFQGWQWLHYDFFVAKLFGGLFLLVAARLSMSMLLIVLLGRIPRSFARVSNTGLYNETFSDTHARIIHEREEERKRTREV